MLSCSALEDSLLDILDIIWNASQERQLGELRGRIDQARLEHDLVGGDRKIVELAEENFELKLRPGLLVRLLIKKGIITAEEFAALVSESHQSSGQKSAERDVGADPRLESR